MEASSVANNHHATLVKAEKSQQVLLRNIRILRDRVVLAERRLRARCVTHPATVATPCRIAHLGTACVAVSVWLCGCLCGCLCDYRGVCDCLSV